MDWTAILNSEAAKQVPVLVGAALLLTVVLIPFVWVTKNNTRATDKLASVLGETRADNRVARTEDHAWHVEKIKILSGLTSQLQTQDGKLDSIHAGVKDIRDRLGNDHGGHGPHNH